MKFKVTARTLLHLGAELISSDGIALYELIKNSFDAGSKNVSIDVQVRLPHRDQQKLLAEISKWDKADKAKREKRKDFLDRIRRAAVSAIDMTAPEAAAVRSEIAAADTPEAMRKWLRTANRIVVTDTGSGMSSATLLDAFLTIGTRNKQRRRAEALENDEVVLGEKGIGRFSTMRLGSLLRVITTTVQDSKWHVLELDWSQFSHDSDELLSEVDIEPIIGPRKTKLGQSGTRIEIDDLNREWTFARASEIATAEFAKLNDPFSSQKRFPIAFRFNDELVPIPAISSVLLRAAHATGTGKLFKTKDGDVLTLEFEYEGRQRAFSFRDEDLLSLSEEKDPEVFDRLGLFQFNFYWFNRRRLSKIEGIGEIADVRKELERWSGGLLLYRDGFRVLPYAGPDDDWLGLDRRALSRSSFRVNRTQLVGRVNISARHNPHLVDQANREGLRDGPEKRTFVALLNYAMVGTFHDFLVSVDNQVKAREPVVPEEVEERLEKEEDRIAQNLKALTRLMPQISEHEHELGEIRAALESIRQVMSEVRAMSDEFEKGRSQLLNLAGIGLTVEILAHELNRTTGFALQMLTRMDSAELPAPVGKTLENLAAQLKTLQKRLRVLDPLSTAGRNRKERFDLIELVRDIAISHKEQFEAEGSTIAVEVHPPSTSRWPVTAVKGMIVQILENLISNSVYWLRYRKILKPNHKGQVTISVDPGVKELRVRDNGPGIPRENADMVFQAFFTTKPADQGKGLGLYVASEIARYHKASLRLEGPDHDGKFRQFVLSLEGAA
jgi:signal transduction histidine kinase